MEVIWGNRIELWVINWIESSQKYIVTGFDLLTVTVRVDISFDWTEHTNLLKHFLGGITWSVDYVND